MTNTPGTPKGDSITASAVSPDNSGTKKRVRASDTGKTKGTERQDAKSRPFATVCATLIYPVVQSAFPDHVTLVDDLSVYFHSMGIVDTSTLQNAPFEYLFGPLQDRVLIRNALYVLYIYGSW